MNLKIAFLRFIVIVFLPILGYSQISVTNPSEIDKIKTGTTFFAMKDPASPKSAAYVEAIKKHWTLNTVECIKYTDVEKNIAPNNSFVTITVNMTSSNANVNTESHIYMELWTTNGKFVYDAKKRRHFNQEDKISIATIELFPDVYAQNNPSSLYKMDYDAGGHLKNMSPALLANYVQQLVTLLKKSEIREVKTAFFNKSEVANLNSQTLFIPDYVLTKFSKNSDDESKKFDVKDMTEGVALSCQFIPMEELSDKIVVATTPVYYLLFIKTNTSRYITVTNSISGEIIYSAYSGNTGNFKAADLKELQKAAQKK